MVDDIILQQNSQLKWNYTNDYEHNTQNKSSLFNLHVQPEI